MRTESLEGTGGFTPDLERLPLEDAWLQTVEPWKGEGKALGLGESECVTMRTGM